MNPDDQPLLERTWAGFRAQPERGLQAFFGRLFELAPDTRARFAHVDLGAQFDRFVLMMDDVVRFGHEPERLVATLAAMGRRHVQYGVRDAHYDLLGEALMYALQEVLGPELTPDARRAWAERYRFAASVMRRAAGRVSQPVERPV